MGETRVNPKTGVIEESNSYGLFWSPKETKSGTISRTNPETGRIEESSSWGFFWRPSTNENGAEERRNLKTGVIEESNSYGLFWSPKESRSRGASSSSTDRGVDSGESAADTSLADHYSGGSLSEGWSRGSISSTQAGESVETHSLLLDIIIVFVISIYAILYMPKGFFFGDLVTSLIVCWALVVCLACVIMPPQSFWQLFGYMLLVYVVEMICLIGLLALCLFTLFILPGLHFYKKDEGRTAQRTAKFVWSTLCTTPLAYFAATLGYMLVEASRVGVGMEFFGTRVSFMVGSVFVIIAASYILGSCIRATVSFIRTRPTSKLS
jgi:hypothetical protein